MNPGRTLSTIALVCVLAQSALAAGGVVEATGEAMIRDNDRVAAKKAATADALKRCIEKVVGIVIESDFSATQQELVRNNKSEFYSKVRDELIQRSQGFIEKYDVVEEWTDGDVLKLKVRATVYDSKIRAEAQKLADLIAAAGNPKLMLVIQDVLVRPDGSREVSQQSVLGAYLEKELLARGFELRGEGRARERAGQAENLYDQWLENPASAASLAAAEGADILIAGRVEIHDKGAITETAGLDALKGQRRVEISSMIRGINAASSDVFSSKPVQLASIGTTVERALHRAFRGRGNNLVNQTFDQLLVDLKESFKKTAEQGQTYLVQLGGIKSFRKQGRAFLRLLRDLEGVGEVKQKSYRDGVLRIDLSCKCNASQLQERIFTAVEGQRALSTLDVASVAGKHLSFGL